MKILISIGMLIVFISVFFMLLLGNSLFSSSFACAPEGGRTVCEFTGLSWPAMMSIIMIIFFVVIDALSVFLIISNLSGT